MRFFLIFLARMSVHLLCLRGVFVGAYFLRLHTDLIPGVQRAIDLHLQDFVLFLICVSGIFVFFGITKKRYTIWQEPRLHIHTFLKVRSYWTVTITFVAYFGEDILFHHRISRLVLIRGILATGGVLPLVDALFHRLLPRKYRLLLLYAQQSDINPILSKISPNSYKAQPFDQYKDKTASGYDYIILCGAIDQQDIEHFFDQQRGQSSKIFHFTQHNIQDILYIPTEIFGLSMTYYKATHLDEWAIIAKRMTDIFGAIFLLLVTFPLQCIVAVLITLTSPGPVFYTQKRVGKGGQQFTFIKFRSMYTHLCVGEKYGGNKAMKYREDLINSDANIRKGELQKIENDPRVTKIGKFIRATSIDELPTLRNVFKGDMSLVGPRPHLPQEVAKYSERQKRLLSIKPGITGYAQIHGRDALSFQQEANYDLYYIQHRSIFVDIYVLLMTFTVLCKGKGK